MAWRSRLATKALALYYQIPWSGQGGPRRKLLTGLGFTKWRACSQASNQALREVPARRAVHEVLGMGRMRVRASLAVIGAIVWTARALGAEPPAEPQGLGASGLALPRFASLKSDRVNLRQGPGTDYPTAWVFRRAGLPVEIVKEFESWRQVRDAEGTTGWVLGSMLSGRRTAVVLPWEQKTGQPQPASAALRDDDSASARPLAYVEAGVLANIISCDG